MGDYNTHSTDYYYVGTLGIQCLVSISFYIYKHTFKQVIAIKLEKFMRR